jgi:hypothetical protein
VGSDLTVAGWSERRLTRKTWAPAYKCSNIDVINEPSGRLADCGIDTLCCILDGLDSPNNSLDLT